MLELQPRSRPHAIDNGLTTVQSIYRTKRYELPVEQAFALTSLDLPGGLQLIVGYLSARFSPSIRGGNGGNILDQLWV